MLCAGIASGLTLGLLSLDTTKLEIKAMIGNEQDREAASALLPFVKRHHFLLATLLLFNSLSNESLPIFLGDLVPNWLAIILSVSLVLVFGEVWPVNFLYVEFISLHVSLGHYHVIPDNPFCALHGSSSTGYGIFTEGSVVVSHDGPVPHRISYKPNSR